jgi:TonB family protein
MARMTLKYSALAILAMICAGCATSPRYQSPTTSPPPLWSGDSGFRLDPQAVRVKTGAHPVGAVIIKQGASLARTGIVKQTIRVGNGNGEIVIPEGTKAFAIDVNLAPHDRSTSKIEPIEWCVILPRPGTVCIAWESATSALYKRDTWIRGFAFLPALQLSGGVRGPVPEIEEGPADFGVRFTKLVRIHELSGSILVLESSYSDGTNTRLVRHDSYKFGASHLLMKTDHYSVAMSRAADGKAMEVRRLDNPDPHATERTVLLELLVGVDGAVKDGRIAVSSGSPQIDGKALEEAKRSWKLTPQPKEQWGRFTVTFKFED